MFKLLIEILSEEMPARMIIKGAEKLDKLLQTELMESASLETLKSNIYHTPRRICFAYQLQENQEDELIRGPRETAPQNAIDGFLKKYKLSNTDELKLVDGFYYHKIVKEKVNIKNATKKSVEIALHKMVWPKSMRWGNNEIKWIRPIHSMISILDGEVLPVEFGPVIASNKTYGHRFLAGKAININTEAEYVQLLQKAFVVVSYEQRKNSILSQINKIIPSGIKLQQDEDLLSEVTNLVEWPVVMLGHIPPNLMKLPSEVLKISLREHQKYLLLEKENGELAPYFIIVSNVHGKNNGEKIIAGNQKVLQARLYDAEFFYEQDKKENYKIRIEKLKSLTYHDEIGSVYDKVKSMAALAEKLAPWFNIEGKEAKEISWLVKNDLVSLMVKEFPELQGVMGYYYALHNNMPISVALAIKDHYKPQGPSDSLPSTSLGKLIAMADKLDNLQQLFSIGIKPTSTKDPFALRRAAIGVIRILTDQKIPLGKLEELNLSDELINFITERKKNM